jgi:hypothetical protein
MKSPSASRLESLLMVKGYFINSPFCQTSRQRWNWVKRVNEVGKLMGDKVINT